jgi:hypothetical protein
MHDNTLVRLIRRSVIVLTILFCFIDLLPFLVFGGCWGPFYSPFANGSSCVVLIVLLL